MSTTKEGEIHTEQQEIQQEEISDEGEKEIEDKDKQDKKSPEEIIEELKRENEELRDKYLRIVAEFDNFRKRQEKIFVEMLEQERNNVIGRLLDIADDVSRAVSAADDKIDPKQLLSGIKLIEQRIFELLKLEGVSAEDPTGKTFDPLEHEAVGVMETENEEEDNIVVKTISPTYKRGNRLVRPAKVFVGKFSPEK